MTGRDRARHVAAAVTLLLASPALARTPGWWPLAPKDTLVVETSKGRIVVEMRPDLAPLAVARVKALARAHVYDGLLFHRVIEGFVDQTGNPNNRDGGRSSLPDLPPEFHVDLDPAKIDAVAVRNGDGIQGFLGATPVAAAPSHATPGRLTAWGIYCTGVAGMGRQAEIGTANSEIFFMRAPSRRLDHDYTVWGRAVQGLDVIRAITAGEPPAHPDRMIRVRVAADMPETERPRLEVVDTASPDFAHTITQLREQHGADFSVCDVPIAVRSAPGGKR